MTGIGNRSGRGRGALLALLGVLAIALSMPGASARQVEDPSLADPEGGAAAMESPWYLERGTERRSGGEGDDIPDVAFLLADLLRDGGIPGFYDGQFASTVERFPELVRVAQDTSMHHTIRIMAVMALQEAADGPELLEALEPLLMDPEEEFAIEWSRANREWRRMSLGVLDEELLRRELDVDLSRYTRFALAKDGQPAPILERIGVLERYVLRRQEKLLDPLVNTFRSFDVFFGRSCWFDIGYHYQQFDDYESAAHWFRRLTDALANSDTRMAHYNLACIAALTGKPDEAVAQLREAMEGGFLDVDWREEDGDLESLRDRADYRALRDEMRGEPVEAPAAPETGDPGHDSVGSVP